MRSNTYSHLFTRNYMMGPCSIRLLDELTSRYSLPTGKRILDLGCGTGLTSLFTAREFSAHVFAVDLWISATANLSRFQQWQVDDQITPIHANALDLPFADGYFDAIVSVDSYHYFASNCTYFQEKLLPLVKPGGWILIAVPGLHREFEETIPQAFKDWAGDDISMFHSCEWWRQAVGACEDIAEAHFWEMETHDEAWQDWFSSGHKYAIEDYKHLSNGIWDYLASVGMAIRKKG